MFNYYLCEININTHFCDVKKQTASEGQNAAWGGGRGMGRGRRFQQTQLIVSLFISFSPSLTFQHRNP